MKLTWERGSPLRPLQLTAYMVDENAEYVSFITEDDMLEIAKWCSESNCGKRTSFDTFRFKNEKQITMFLIKWS